MPDPSCSDEAGCTEDRHFCVKGFPRGTFVLNHKAQIRGKSDYKVLLYSVRAFRGVWDTNSRTKYAIFTSDRRFWQSARHMFDSLNGRAPRHIKFTQKNFISASVESDGKRYRIRIRIEYISRNTNGSKKKLGKKRGLKPEKKRILKKSIEHARRLLD